ncbi:hypothetical protein D9757_001849 [Collybiopsis confluens]|uniref:ADF-H domain-containing protein n=1 Tax=Collybiopsis confluens TaxID=2823264 RepID=A0A8H5HYZ2_9AGAR|nr:hypothetical protein D9757_001849 [Collybiopsis confluens]
MSATSGIGVSPELSAEFASALESRSVRFIKISIQNESLVHDQSIPIEGSLNEDLAKLQDLLQDDVPAYILTKLDDSEWLAIYYVPDSAKVRDKMLYASSRASLLKSLGSTTFTDNLFATSKSDLTPESYLAHRKHMAAPKPLSAREQEVADIRAAERENAPSYEGSRTRQSMVGTGVGLKWSLNVESAVEDLGKGQDSAIVVITIDTSTETLVLESTTSYAFFAWPHNYTDPAGREIVFIYSCPSTSPVKHRMLYSSGSSGVFQAAKTLLSSSLNARKIETSDPAELDEAFLKSELGFDNKADITTAFNAPLSSDSVRSFAKPRGPARRRP